MNLASTIDLLYGNRKLHKRIKFQGLDVSVENRKGSVRTGVDPSWGPWRTKMLYDYGYLKNTKGFDGGGVDCFIGPKVDAKMAYVVHIMKPPSFKVFDEDKCMLGFGSAKEAKAAFMKHYDDPGFYGGMSAIDMTDFKKKVLKTGQKGPMKIEANLGEPQVYDGGYAHLEVDVSKTSPPSLKKPYYVPSPSDPRESDDKFGDVTRRKSAATKARRDSLTRQHTDQNMTALNRTLITGMPSGTIGGFG